MQTKAVTQQMDNERQSQSSSMPLVSRVDHLDSVMKYLERKENISSWGNDAIGFGKVKRQCMPLDFAVREAYSKGSLLDRIASLENRLFQLCLEMESCSVLRTSVPKSGSTSSALEFSRELSCSFPIFNIQNHGYKQESKVHVKKFEFQRKSHEEQQRLKHPSTTKQQSRKNKPKRDERACKSAKEEVPHNWPHLKILGC